MGSSLIVLIALSRLLAASADPAEMLIKQGVELRRAGNDAKALSKFERAYQMSHSPRAAAQLGLCEQALEEWEAAEGHLSEALTSSSDLWVGRNRQTIQLALEIVRKQLVFVTVVGDPPVAVASLNDRLLGSLGEGAEARVAPGTLKIDVVAPGYQPFQETRSASAGETVKVTASLKRLAADVAAAAIPDGSALRDRSKATQVVEQGASAPSRSRAIAKWSAGGASLIGVGVGVFGLIRNRSGVADFNRSCGFRDGQATPLPSSDLTAAGCNDLEGDYSQAATISAVGFVSAAALGAVAVWLHVTEHEDDEPRSLSCLPSLGSGMGAA